MLSANRPANQTLKMIMMALFLLIAFISEAVTAIQNPVCPNRHWVTVPDGYYLFLSYLITTFNLHLRNFLVTQLLYNSSEILCSKISFTRVRVRLKQVSCVHNSTWGFSCSNQENQCHNITYFSERSASTFNE